MRGRAGSIRLGQRIGLCLAAVHPEGDDGDEGATRGDQRTPGEHVLHRVTPDQSRERPA